MSEISGVPPPDTELSIEIRNLDPTDILPTPHSSESPLTNVDATVSTPSPPIADIVPEIAIPNPIPNPVPSLNTNSNPVPKLKPLLKWAPIYLSKTDRVVERLAKILEKPGDTDSLLNAVCYSALLVSVLLRKFVAIQEGNVRRRAEGVIKVLVGGAWEGGLDLSSLLGGKSGLLGGILVGREGIEGLAGRLKVFSGLISRVRTFLRVFGFVGIWRGGRGVLVRVKGGKRDAGLVLDGLGVIFGLCYQICESGAYLSGKGVMGWDLQRQNRANVWSSRFWGVGVGLDLIKLGREWRGIQEKRRIAGKGMGEKEQVLGNGEQSLEEMEVHVKRRLAIDLAYAPLTVHWGLESGLVSEAWVGILGSVAGGLGLREKWRLAGLEIERLEQERERERGTA